MPRQLPASMLQQDSDSRPYWEGLAQGELRIQRCSSCSKAVFYPRSICPHCFSDQLTWMVASGKGTIYTYTVAHQAFGAFAEDVPFVIALVELEEGVRMMTRIIGADRDTLAVGKGVHVTFESVGEDMTLPYFSLIEETRS
ncbi:Zn-ribbon domain-containing OB-fold protein [Ktedonospora formicarum]|nr:Zn-ribbon domain-containing OB-fold protein [Ktedonospora formicarum]